MGVGARGPGEPEESMGRMWLVEISSCWETFARMVLGQVYLPDRNAKAAHLGAQEPVLGRNTRSALFESALVVFGVVEAVDEKVRDNTENNSETDSEESEAVLPGVEAVDGLESERVSGKEGEKHGKGERRVEAEEENRRFGDQHL